MMRRREPPAAGGHGDPNGKGQGGGDGAAE